MSRINAACFCAALLTTVVLLLTQGFPALPVWSLFITWACFFHLGGDRDPASAFRITVTHVGLGVFTAWLTALLLFANPWTDSFLQQAWGPVIIGLVIGILVRLSAIGHFAVTPAIIYGYASVWAFLSIGEHFSLDALQSVSMRNVIVAIPPCILMGAAMGAVNAYMVDWLSKPEAAHSNP
jgi:hypothetical protein